MHEGRLVAGKYRIAQLVAAGSMGEIYEAVHVGIGKHVALKAMPHELTSTEELVARFRREVRAAGMLESEYIVQVFDAGQDDALGLYYVTELLVGEDLEERLERERRLDASTAAAVGYEVARGLAKAHASGVIHRDLKPSNVFLAERDGGARVAKILDFGVSKCRTFDDLPGGPETETDEGFSTAAGVTLGTPQYMSPEQAQGLPDVDGRTDVWSLAATLYEALSGEPLFEGSSPLEVMMRVIHEDARPLAVVAPWVPAALRDVVHAGLARDRRKRTPDAASFAEALALAMPGARWSLRDEHRSLRPRAHAIAATTIPAPPPSTGSTRFEEEPPSSGGSHVQFFRRHALH